MVAVRWLTVLCVATITAFSDPAVRVTGVSATAVSGGFTVRATGTLS